MQTPVNDQAVILLSGGLDSATTFVLAQQMGYACYALSVDYGQRHSVELKAAENIARRFGAITHRVVKVDLTQFGGSALTDKQIAVPQEASPGIPITYVPARNTIMLSLALAWSEVLAVSNIFIGVNAVDYSGYPDCRPEYIKAFEQMANLATKRAVEGMPVRIHSPLISWSKTKIIEEGTRLGLDYAITISCYQPSDSGLACRVCDACRLRIAGFQDAGVDDPTPYISL